MTAFENTLTKSKAINRFMQVERLSENAVYELYLDCYFSYRDMFVERIRYGAELRRVISTYKGVALFGQLAPREIETIVFNSPVMHQWFVFRFWMAIERQVTTGQIDAGALQTELTFMNQIPSASTMEEILVKAGVGSRELAAKNTNQLTINL